MNARQNTPPSPAVKRGSSMGGHLILDKEILIREHTSDIHQAKSIDCISGLYQACYLLSFPRRRESMNSNNWTPAFAGVTE